MKVALCLSGQPRNALETFPWIKKNIIEPNEADVFIHMHYDSSNLYMEKSHADKGNCQLVEGLDQQLIELYGPKRYLIEAPRDFKKPGFLVPENRLKNFQKMNAHKNWTEEEHRNYMIKQMTSMYYSIYKANEMKELYANENGIVYDYVIRLRFDFLPRSPLVVSRYNPRAIHYLEVGQRYIRIGNQMFLEIGQRDQLISDWINFGSNAVMNVYASLYLQMDYLNTFQYYSKEERLPNTLEPSDVCGGLAEHMLRDLMCLHRIPKVGFYLMGELTN